MKAVEKVTYAVLAIIALQIAIMALWGVGSYNALLGQEQRVKTSWAEVENQLQRRNDLIPNLVETVRGYSIHEREIIERIAEAREKLMGAQTVGDKISASNEITGLLSRLAVIVENYPNLKADTTFVRLMDEIAGTENRLAVARRRYNEAVGDYNLRLKRFPTVIIASAVGFKEKDFYEVPEEAKKVPKVDLSR
ncbi:MAG: LemA family protein [bacterium]